MKLSFIVFFSPTPCLIHQQILLSEYSECMHNLNITLDITLIQVTGISCLDHCLPSFVFLKSFSPDPLNLLTNGFLIYLEKKHPGLTQMQDLYPYACIKPPA